MNRAKYLIILENGHKGYLIKRVETLEEAVELQEKVHQTALIGVSDDVLSQHVGYLDSYPINGNETSVSNIERGMTNGIIHVSIMKIDDYGAFSIEQFKLERANTSTVFNYEDYSDEMDRVCELFFHTSFVSN